MSLYHLLKTPFFGKYRTGHTQAFVRAPQTCRIRYVDFLRESFSGVPDSFPS
jgi:hypothetical protein